MWSNLFSPKQAKIGIGKGGDGISAMSIEGGEIKKSGTCEYSTQSL